MKKEVIGLSILICFVCFQYFIVDYNKKKKAQIEAEQSKKDSILLIETYIYEHSKIPEND